MDAPKDNYTAIFVMIAVGLTLFAIAFPFIINGFFFGWQTNGTFGDTFGALNAVFSGLAFSGVIVTILNSFPSNNIYWRYNNCWLEWRWHS